jgi:Uma2 family endonuclease
MGRSSYAHWENSTTLPGSKQCRSGFGCTRRNWHIRVRPELRIRVAATRFRVPDVTLLEREQPIEQIAAHAPLAVFEILSPEERVQRLKRKLEDYKVMGIPQIWVIDPQDDTFCQ